MNDQTIDHEIRDKVLTAPRVTPADIEANIAEECYFTGTDGLVGNLFRAGHVIDPHVKGIGPLSLLTFCVLVLKNGFTVTGEFACASSEDFDSEMGRMIARQYAISKARHLMGYALKEKLDA
jgi:hypothetical protein